MPCIGRRVSSKSFIERVSISAREPVFLGGAGVGAERGLAAPLGSALERPRIDLWLETG